MVTPYDDYDTYSTGDTWDYNDEIAALFEDRVAKGPIANRPDAAEAPDNVRYHATDEDLVYKNDPSVGWMVAGHGSAASSVPEAHIDSIAGGLTITGGDLDVSSGFVHAKGAITSRSFWNVFDSTNSQHIAQFNEGGNVDIPSGKLSIPSGNVTIGSADSKNVLKIARYTNDVASEWDDLARIEPSTGSAGIGLSYHDGTAWQLGLAVRNNGNVDVPNGNLDIGGHFTFNDYIQSSSGTRIHFTGSDLSYSLSAGTIGAHRFDAADGTTIAYLRNSGKVEIPNGNLDFNDADISGLGRIFADRASPSLLTNGSGTGQWRFRDAANSQDIAVFREGGNVEVPSGNLEVLGGMFRVQGSAGNLKLDGSGARIEFTRNGPNYLDVSGGATANLSIRNSATNTITQFNESGNVEIPNGHIDVAEGVENQQRGAPATGELASGATMVYTSDGTDAGAAGDLMYAINDAGTIKTQVITAAANAT